MSIVIAGGTKGIGLEIAAHFASKGATVVLGYARDAGAAHAAKRRIEEAAGRALLVQADVRTPEGLTSSAASYVQGQVVYVNGAQNLMA